MVEEQTSGITGRQGFWPRGVRRFSSSLLTVATVMVLILAVSMAVLIRTGPNGITTAFGRPLFSVMSGSMSPTFNTGDVIVDKPVSAKQADQLHKGEIITFRAHPSAATGGTSLIITHRIFRVVAKATNPGGVAVYQTKGDANNAPDAFTVSSRQILGLYQGERVPFGAYAISALHQPITFVVLLLMAVLMMASAALRLGPASPPNQARPKAAAAPRVSR